MAKHVYFLAERGILCLGIAAINNLRAGESNFAACARARWGEVEVPAICSATGVVPFRLDAR